MCYATMLLVQTIRHVVRYATVLLVQSMLQVPRYAVTYTEQI